MIDFIKDNWKEYPTVVLDKLFEEGACVCVSKEGVSKWLTEPVVGCECYHLDGEPLQFIDYGVITKLFEHRTKRQVELDRSLLVTNTRTREFASGEGMFYLPRNYHEP